MKTSQMRKTKRLPKATSPDWVEQELATLALKDKRLTKRAKEIVRQMAQHPTGSIPQFSQDWSATKAAYRFFDNEKSDAEAIVSAQREATLGRMRQYSYVLCLHDTTDISLGQYPSIKGKGALPRGQGKRRGFLAHNTLAVSESGIPLGLLAQQTWVRPLKKQDKKRQRKRPIEAKESYKWLQAVVDSTQDELPMETKLLFVSDRESDVMEYFTQKRSDQVDILLRATQNRRLEDSDALLWPTLSRQSVAGSFTVEIGRRHKQPPRTATCQVRYRQVFISPPNSNRTGQNNKLQPIKMTAIVVTELDPPGGITPISWRLLTSVPVHSLAEAQRLVRFYALRWLVERFHFVLKSGCSIEKRRLASVAAMKRLLAITNIVAWRLLWLTYQARITPLAPASLALTPTEWQVLYMVHHKTTLLPQQPPTLKEAVLWLACLGGFLARTADGPPGVKVLWRGWKSLSDQLRLYHIFASAPPLPFVGNA